ncbi:Fibrinogen-like protein 1,Angiopoietin-related protein 2,Ficolin-1 [Mytilus coruscus]|uniref:Fibrinogen-like protein 1,Angiopoietin-related protein 2,Ficolin-1 n=1 Tax=Mytilus coruscus TaxID=42192 RepID=A0A6J8B6K8_MYTCO|nr:Fibrinogen-like protein 1,Angiopoietin-related protein 2,Ficolin-1 [Mytilus coruscus]
MSKIARLVVFVAVCLFNSYISQTEGYGQTCASCTGVEVADECHHHIICDVNEVCSMHHYITESGASLFDYGCAFPQACLQSFGPVFGRRSEGHHVKCTVCCNDTKVCNENLTCQKYPHILLFPTECSEVKGYNLKSGIYTIYPTGKQTPSLSVFCEADSNGSLWTITSNGVHSLQFIMTDYEGVTKYANYKSFIISNETSGYKLSVGNYSGDAGDSFTTQNGQKFTTKDRDNDPYSGNCATLYIGAWWYGACHSSNLNGKYYYVSKSPYAKGINWFTWHGHYYSLKSTTMMIRKNTK